MKFALKIKGKSLPKGPITVHIKGPGQGQTDAQPSYEKSKKTYLFGGKRNK